MSKMKLFWKVLGWLFLAGVVIFVGVVVFVFFMFDSMINQPICDSAEEVVVMMEEYVEYDFDSDDYEVEEWYCWGFPDLQKGVTLYVKDKKIWNDFVKRYKVQVDTSFSETYDLGVKKITIESNKDSYRKHCEWRREEPYEWEEESFVLDYKNRTIKYLYFEE